MTIESVRMNGKEMAKCICTKCEKREYVPALHGSTKGTFTGELPPVQHPDKVIEKLRKMNWYVTPKRMYCPDCAKSMKKSKVAKMQARTLNIPKNEPANKPAAQPTAEQKREILFLLQDVYDTENQRYKGSETDKSVADTIGNDTPIEWVAKLRDDFFGPEGNEAKEDIKVLVNDTGEWLTKAEAIKKNMQEHVNRLSPKLAEFNKAMAEIKDLKEKLEKHL